MIFHERAIAADDEFHGVFVAGARRGDIDAAVDATRLNWAWLDDQIEQSMISDRGRERE